MLTRCWPVLAVALLIGCASAPPRTPPGETGSGPDAPEPAPAARQPATPSRAEAPAGPLAAEQRWLAELFAGTPVQVRAERDGAVRVAVPLQFAFAHGSAQIEPALQAVLDRVGQSLKRRPTARLAQWAPGTESAARQRAIRAHLIGLGLASHRVSAVAPPADSYSVVLRLSMPPAPVQRLGRALPSTGPDGASPLRPPAAG